MFNAYDVYAYFCDVARALRDSLKSCFDKYRAWMTYKPPRDDT